MDPQKIRNFVIIAHVDHGKSTLADRFLELTGTVEKRKLRAQFLDQMELEQEKGITIKMQPVRMTWNIKSKNRNGEGEETESYILNLIDTPGHVDFSYEVSRALAAVEGAILLVDASQGVQAQTIANCELAKSEGLVIIPAVNKIDLPGVDIAGTKSDLADIIGCRENEIFSVSGKTGENVSTLLDAVVHLIPWPEPDLDRTPRALIFDSHFDSYRGVIAHVRVFGGEFRSGMRLTALATNARFELLELGHFIPALAPADSLGAGEIGYFATGLKEPDAIRVGDTISTFEIRNSQFEIAAVEPLPGYRTSKPVVFASIYPKDPDEYERLLDALKKVKLSDAALFFEPEASDALGRGFRTGFLGMLHMEIIAERLRREYGLEILLTAPSVAYRVLLVNGEERSVYSASRMPDRHLVREIREPWVRLEVLVPTRSLGDVMALLSRTRGHFVSQEHLGGLRVRIEFEIPLRDVLVDFFDNLKSVTAGYGSFSYEPIGERAGDLVRLDILVADVREEALSQIVPKHQAYTEGRFLTAKLKELLPKQLFAVSIQAAADGRVLARETLPALKKDVTGYLYGGDRTRKMKLWKKQQRGKKRLREGGRVEIPPDVFLRLLKRG